MSSAAARLTAVSGEFSLSISVSCRVGALMSLDPASFSRPLEIARWPVLSADFVRWLKPCGVFPTLRPSLCLPPCIVIAQPVFVICRSQTSAPLFRVCRSFLPLCDPDLSQPRGMCSVLHPVPESALRTVLCNPRLLPNPHPVPFHALLLCACAGTPSCAQLHRTLSANHRLLSRIGV